MSGKSRILRKKLASRFLAAICATALSIQPDCALRNCTKIGTDILYIEIVMECVLAVGNEHRSLTGFVSDAKGLLRPSTRRQRALCIAQRYPAHPAAKASHEGDRDP